MTRLSVSCPTFDIGYLDELPLYFGAFGHAAGLLNAAEKPNTGLPQLFKAARKVRASLLKMIDQAVDRGWLNKDVRDRFSGRKTVLVVASDLRSIGGILEEVWLKHDRASPGALAELEAARRLSDRTLEGVTHRQRRNLDPAALDMRNRAFTLLARHYDEVRRAITYVRWKEKDADRIAPCLSTVPKFLQRRKTPAAKEKARAKAQAAAERKRLREASR